MRKRRPQRPVAARRSLPRKPPYAGHLTEFARRPAVVGVGLLTAAAFFAFLTLRSKGWGVDIVGAFSKTGRVRKESTGSAGNGVSVAMAPVFRAEVVAEYVHDAEAFTQGLVWHDGMLYESTGLQGRSSVRAVEFESGKVVRSHKLKYVDFGEGLCLFGATGDYLLQVLWKVGKGYLYSRDTLERVLEFRFKGDAWGVALVPGTADSVYLSDGSSQIYRYRLDGTDFKKVSAVTVRDGDKAVGLLNELEMVGGELWANVWMCDFVARIDPLTGKVKGWVDLRDLLSKADIPQGHTVDVLNGIAWDESQGRVLVTGKLWPKLYAIRVSDEQVAERITKVTNAFFLDSSRVRYVLDNVLA
eukprot:GFKZ01016094.1.p1 GENE.GFKZ01016094.1~~GFKZ01016094.1.p1  ORF type:complete len:400 (-),score=53.75 GFKZ01016094.1:3270-4343(-)